MHNSVVLILKLLLFVVAVQENATSNPINSLPDAGK